MSVPKKKSATRRRKLRASHHGLKKTSLSKCSKCNKAVQPHTVCKNCGYYKGRNVLNLESKMDKKAKKALRKKEEDKKLQEQEQATK